MCRLRGQDKCIGINTKVQGPLAVAVVHGLLACTVSGTSTADMTLKLPHWKDCSYAQIKFGPHRFQEEEAEIRGS